MRVGFVFFRRSASRAVALAVVAGAVLGAPQTARADVIDGTWCFADGRYLEINGAKIRTPGGRHIEGDYGRHDFSYTVPAGETGAGEPVNMELLDEYTVEFHHGAPGRFPTQTLTRCNPHTS